VFQPSRLFVYYNERLVEGTVSQDSGAFIRDGIKTLNTYGVCSEAVWPYNISQYTTKPSDAAYAQAKLHTALAYYRVNVAINDVKAALAAGFPIVIGLTLYESFESYTTAATGVVTMPKPYEQVLGGHAVAIVGYNDAKKQLIVRNSWGTNWGDKGYFYLPYSYINTNLASDLWVVSSVK
jgi:C1A family cysteine protease